jgi:hypothetical protein
LTLSDDEKAVKASGVKDHFFAYLKEKSTEAQFVIIENDPPPLRSKATPKSILSLAMRERKGGRDSSDQPVADRALGSCEQRWRPDRRFSF